LYIAGESYAGQYIPYIAKAIIDRNKQGSGTPWNLQGVMIGNGWISPIDQYPSYLKFAYAEGLIKEGDETSTQLEEKQKRCSEILSADGAKDRVDINECEDVLSTFLSLTISDGKCTNMYDVRLREDDTCGASWPPDLASMTSYLRRPDVAEALNLNHDKSTAWQECTGNVGVQFRIGKSIPSIQILPEVIESGVRVLLFSGDKDMICNHLGTEQLIHNMKWNGGTGFETSPGVWAPRRGWTFDDEPAGYYQQARNLTYILFYNASHMVPFDWPRRSRDMLDRFINVNITSIGGSPGDSRLDGEKLPETTVGGHKNETTSTEHEDEKLKDAEWKAYTKSGEAALIVVIIGVSVWGYFIYRSRRQHRGYRSVYRDEISPDGSSTILNRFRKNERSNDRDLEATDFDESELDRLDRTPNMEPEHYIIDDDEEHETPQGGGHSQGK
jgi:carboxypeptidase D